MRVTPLDIRKQEFKKVMRGLDSEEVYAFLNTVAEEYEAVLSDNKNIREKLVALEERLKEFQAIETNLRNTLLTAEKLTHEAKENARREASLLIREAEMEAEKASETIRAHTTQLRREILELKKNKDNYITRLKTLIDSHKKMLEGFEEDFAGVDQEIEKIGRQVESDAQNPNAPPPRMSRDKITEEFGQAPKDKVTWGDERRREDEPRPQMPRPGVEPREAPNQQTKQPEDILMNIFSEPVESAPAAQPAQQPFVPQPPKMAAEPRAEQARTTVADMPPQAQPQQPASTQPAQPEAPRAQDDWRGYEVRKQATDWKSYEIANQQQAKPKEAERTKDVDVEDALSSLKEVTTSAEPAPRREMSQSTATAPRAQAPAPHQPTPQPQQAAQPAGAPAGEAPWSLEELRRNLTNLSKKDGNQG